MAGRTDTWKELQTEAETRSQTRQTLGAEGAAAGGTAPAGCGERSARGAVPPQGAPVAWGGAPRRPALLAWDPAV